jgi:diguanylate cyclase (GGDEF)-like protein
MGQEVKGALILFSRASQPPDQELLQTMTDLGSQIGQFMLRQRAEDQLWRNALYDELTGLPSRLLFKDRLEAELRQARRYPENKLAVLFLDVDRFKHINDTLGYAVGDQVLVAMARKLEVCLRPEDTVARFNADAFVILVKNFSGLDHLIQVAQRIQGRLREPLMVSGRKMFITVSIGIAPSAAGVINAEDMLRDADMAMHRAKELGKDRWVIFDELLRQRSTEFYNLERELRLALERRDFQVFYQPVVCLASGRLTGFEALVRWQHPEQGLMLPGKFIPLAEETGLILPLGQWVLEEACRQMQAWQNGILADSLVVSVNLSGRQFAQEDLVEQVARTLRETGLAGERLKLEITETAVMEDAQVAIATLTALTELGIRMSIDDFGTGYSSMRYLQRLPVDSLKIDYSFVSRISKSEEDDSIVRAIISLAHSLGKQVVAEGIETEVQLRFLQAEDCDYGQGFLFSPALAPDAVAAAIAADSSWPQNQQKPLVP